MALYNIFEISGSGMSAQSIRLNTTASNIANANSVASSSAETYKAKHPVFSSLMQDSLFGTLAGRASSGVKVEKIYQSQAEPIARYQPDNPLADEKGFIYLPNINLVEEMANMISASRSYEANVQVASIAKSLLTKTLSLGR